MNCAPPKIVQQSGSTAITGGTLPETISRSRRSGNDSPQAGEFSISGPLLP